jgi:gliding motility-associated lipoprotein GldH
MRKFVLVLSLIGFVACHSNRNGNVLISREFPTSSWERFDFLEETLELKKPASYDFVLNATFTPEYPFDYFEVAFTVFDNHDHPLRGKNYQFKVKDRDGVWKSELTENEYRFNFPINSALTLNEPGKYKFQIENRMPITPLLGIKEVKLIDK